MKLHLTAATLATAFLLAPLRAEEAKFPPINPALLYWQAAALLPKLSEEQAAEMRDMAAGKKPVDAAKVSAYGLGSGERLIRKAAASTAPCDWGLVVEDGPAMAMPHLSKLREMAALATVEAEARFAEGKTAEGLDWLLTVHRMGRHAGVGDTLISYLVQASIESLALRSAARHCLGWDEGTRRGYQEKLKALPPPRSLADSYRGEQIFVDWLERLVQSSGGANAQQLKEILGTGAPGSQEQAELIRRLTAPDSARKEIAAMRAFYGRIEAVFGRSWNDSVREIQALQDEIKLSDSLAVRQLAPAIVSVHEKAFVSATVRLMLDAALQHGAAIDEAAVAVHKDAFEGKPLRLKRAPDGSLTLVTADQHPKGKDIELKLEK